MAKRSITLGVVSDTHLPRFGDDLPPRLRETFECERVDGIIHCGDIVQPGALELFEAIAPVVAVAGNNDAPELVRALGYDRIVEFGALRIGVTHGHLGPGKTTPVRAFRRFASERVDAVLFGHSHIPYCEVLDGVLLFNPGSPTDKRRQPLRSFGLLRIASGRIEPELVYF